MKCLACAAIAAIAMPASLSAKRKDDKVVVANGDSIVGEIKELANGELRVSADYIVDPFNVDWNRVRELTSLDMFRVFVSDGRHLTGLIAVRGGAMFEVTPEGEPTIMLAQSQVIGLLPVEASFWNQLTGKISSGFNYTSADSQTQLSVSGSLGYEADRYSFALTGGASFSSHTNTTDKTSTTRSNADLTNLFPVGLQWFAANFVGVSSSEEQDLDLRSTVGGGVGRWFARTTRVRLAAAGGLIYTHEVYSTQDDLSQSGKNVSENLEAVGNMAFSFHRFKTLDLQANFSVYPSFTSLGRVRLSFTPMLSVELARNLYWDFSLYENYDSQPPVVANKNDFGITNSVAWKF